MQHSVRVEEHTHTASTATHAVTYVVLCRSGWYDHPDHSIGHTCKNWTAVAWSPGKTACNRVQSTAKILNGSQKVFVIKVTLRILFAQPSNGACHAITMRPVYMRTRSNVLRWS